MTSALVLQDITTTGTPVSLQRHKLQYFGRVVRARNLCTEILEEKLVGKIRRDRTRQR